MSVDVLKAESTVWVEVMQWRNKQNIGTVSNLHCGYWAILELK